MNLNTTSSLFSEVLKLLKLLFVLPASTASAERSFSSLRRLKTYLRSSITAQRLNHVLLLHIHKDITEQLDPQWIEMNSCVVMIEEKVYLACSNIFYVQVPIKQYI